jgi:hypothetical protein
MIYIVAWAVYGALVLWAYTENMLLTSAIGAEVREKYMDL